MRALDLKSTTLPLTLPFIRAYPNLERLAFHVVSSEYGNPGPHLWDTWLAQNMHEQQRAGLAWERLRAFDGALPALYALGLTCGIERVALSHVHSSRGHMLGPVLACARPRVLTLEGWPGVVRAPQGENTFAARLEDLTIEARLGNEHVQVDLGVALDGLLDALAGAPLRQFTLRIYTENIEPPGGLYDYEALANGPLSTVERAARDLDVVEFLGRLMAAIPTLGAAVVSVQGPCNSHRWRTARFADGRVSFEDSAVLPVRPRRKGVR
ncbi:uncharacterized protein TRAVEDRAFT_52342 [Trametes versicolor FP-101664 SS1]|uniref:uncharacterized protein n=1 Tax=Trametes versicolor (strain FP-101664) TaxID=717944 RepID=UPI0004622A47|nr:uncharacterized protein TRAVEDRAFT_52342 [Trametes versicolor FP-101664 SS1]EIW53209.1 hypothetical protein TRAVEDRAFT_52342 [Trametes versicolor FP-101664 SS1]